VTEFRTETTRTEPVRPARVVRFNDMIMEYLIALSRALTVGMLGWSVLSVFAIIWAYSWHWLATLGFSLMVVAGCGWFGFIQHYNEEWREKKDGTTE